MLPRGLYEMLPWTYLVAGVLGALLIESTLMMIGAMLLISAGMLTLFMRYQYRRGIGDVAVERAERRCGDDRRQRMAVVFPMLDNSGQLILADRRVSDRREEIYG